MQTSEVILAHGRKSASYANSMPPGPKPSCWLPIGSKNQAVIGPFIQSNYALPWSHIDQSPFPRCISRPVPARSQRRCPTRDGQRTGLHHYHAFPRRQDPIKSVSILFRTSSKILASSLLGDLRGLPVNADNLLLCKFGPSIPNSARTDFKLNFTSVLALESFAKSSSCRDM